MMPSQINASTAFTPSDKSMVTTEISKTNGESFEETMRRLIIILKHFLDGRFSFAYDQLLSYSSPLDSHLKAVFLYIRAVFSFDPDEVQEAMTALQTVIDWEPPDNTIPASKRVTTWLMSKFMDKSGQTSPTPASLHFPLDQKLIKHMKLSRAECIILRTCLALATDRDGGWQLLFKEAIHLRQAYLFYYDQQQHIQPDPEDREYQAGIELGRGFFVLLFGLLPVRLVRVLEIFGYSVDEEGEAQKDMIDSATDGINELPRISIERTEKSSNHRHHKLTEEEHFLKCAAADGTARQLFAWLIVLLSELTIKPLLKDNCPKINDETEQILENVSRAFPSSPITKYCEAKVAYLRHDITRSIEIHSKLLDSTRSYADKWFPFEHIMSWELVQMGVSRFDWDLVSEQAHNLTISSQWSKAFFGYVEGIVKADLDLLSMVPGRVRRIAGQSIPLERFATRRIAAIQRLTNESDSSSTSSITSTPFDSSSMTDAVRDALTLSLYEMLMLFDNAEYVEPELLDHMIDDLTKLQLTGTEEKTSQAMLIAIAQRLRGNPSMEWIQRGLKIDSPYDWYARALLMLEKCHWLLAQTPVNRKVLRHTFREAESCFPLKVILRRQVVKKLEVFKQKHKKELHSDH